MIEGNGKMGTVKNRLKVILAEKGISQARLSEAIGIKPTTLSNIITGHQNATLETALDIAKYLNTTVEKIFYKENNNDELSVGVFAKMISNWNELYELYKRDMFAEDILRTIYQRQKDSFIDEYGIMILDYLVDENIETFNHNRFAMDILLGR
jgi:putative transcriptional regulator